jgi:hypothetical protein
MSIFTFLSQDLGEAADVKAKEVAAKQPVTRKYPKYKENFNTRFDRDTRDDEF